jgi:hypothetical protein
MHDADGKNGTAAGQPGAGENPDNKSGSDQKILITQAAYSALRGAGVESGATMAQPIRRA